MVTFQPLERIDNLISQTTKPCCCTKFIGVETVGHITFALSYHFNEPEHLLHPAAIDHHRPPRPLLS